MQIDEDELTTASTHRLQRFFSQEVVEYATLKSNIGLDPQRQLDMAREIRNNLEGFIPALQWSGLPTYQQLLQLCDLLWRHFDGQNLGSGSVRSARQLAYLINSLRAAPTISTMIQSQTQNPDDPDAAVQQVLDFLRLWANFHFPRLLRALDKIQQDLFSRARLRPGNYEYFASRVENYFLDPAIVALDEYGIPLEIARKLHPILATDGDLDATLERMRALNLERTDLTRFEKKLVRDARECF